jgi:nucleoside-diphosphate-sugar epimerase
MGVSSDAPEAAPAAARAGERLKARLGDEVVLVTGFPGTRAQALVEVLCEREPNIELWLVVPPTELERAARSLASTRHARERLRLIPGEPCAIDLGVSRQIYAELAERVQRWFSVYQTVDLRASRELAYRVNLGVAREIAELAKVSECLLGVTLLSSGAVFGNHAGAVAEEDLRLGQSFRSPAAESLALAEQLLRRKLAEVPITVLRTPQVLGPRSGRSLPRPAGLHRLLAVLASAPADSALPLPPGANRPVQALPADFVAEALYAVSVLGTRGHAYHVTDHAPPLLAEVLERAAVHFGKRLEQSFDPRALGRMLLKSPGFWLSQQSSGALSEWAEGPDLQTRGGDRLLERAGLRAPSLLDYLDAVLRETQELIREHRLEPRYASTPFEVIA